jgi:hypothetical protein
MGILLSGRDATGPILIVLPGNRLILLHFKYDIVTITMYAQTEYEDDVCRRPQNDIGLNNLEIEPQVFSPGVILSGAVFQAERRACPSEVEGDLPRTTVLREIPRPAGESAGLRNDAAFDGRFQTEPLPGSLES